MTGKPKIPILPKVLMEPEKAVRLLRTLTGGQFNKAMCWEIAAVIEQLAEKARNTDPPALTNENREPIDAM